MRRKRPSRAMAESTRYHGAPGLAPASGQAQSPLEAVIAETVALFHRLRVAAEQMHRQGETTAGKRGILVSLDRFGPQTVPQMARARPVSRQYIQTLVNQLLAEGHVELRNNPAHKRSPLARLTQQGEAFVNAMTRREAKVLSRLKLDISENNLQTAVTVLRALRELFEGGQWKRVVKTVR